VSSTQPGQIVVLNGAPRSGKSSIVAAVQETFDGTWINLGVDVARVMTPPRLQPGIGLRPGEATHAVAPFVPLLYAALYESVAAHSKLGLSVAVDVGHYDSAILADAARRVVGPPVLFVGVRCPIEVVMERRRAAGPSRYATAEANEPIPPGPSLAAGRSRWVGLRPRSRHVAAHAAGCSCDRIRLAARLRHRRPSHSWRAVSSLER
jgi:chloramphenicol 3-O phosphotransferase